MGLPLTRGSARSRPVRLPLPLAYPWWRLAAGLGVLVLIAVIAVGVGSVYIPPQTVVQIVAGKIPFLDIQGGWPEIWDSIIWQLRFPRVVLAGVVGSALAVSGATYQGLFRNPLADPYFIGVAAGAALGATVVVLTSVPFYFHGFSVLPVASFVGAIVAVTMAYSVARQSGPLPLLTLILAGLAISALAQAVTGYLIINSNPDVRPLLAWLLGGFIGAPMERRLHDLALPGRGGCGDGSLCPHPQYFSAQRGGGQATGRQRGEDKGGAHSRGVVDGGSGGIGQRHHRLRGHRGPPRRSGSSGGTTTDSSFRWR